MLRHSYFIVLFLLLLAVIVHIQLDEDANAQTVQIASSPNPVGSGARAMGMGGAFISVADDATAASWNPGGLVQLERPELSAVYSFNGRTEDYASESYPGTAGSNSMTSGSLNYLSAAWPFKLLQRNMVLSLNYQRLYDFNKEISLDYASTLTQGNLNDHINFSQKGGLKTISPAFAVQVAPGLSVGATLNIWEDIFGHNGWDETYKGSSEGNLNGDPVVMKMQFSDRYSFSGTNMHFGFLWNATGKLSLGGVYKTSFKADLRRHYTASTSQIFPTLPPAYSSENSAELNEDLTLKMPSSYGIGVSMRFSDNLSAALDVYRTEWGEYLLIKQDGSQWRPVTGRPKETSTVKPTHQVRLGAEYLFIGKEKVVPLRAGLFYDPEPSENHPEDYYGFSLGSGYKWKNMLIDIAYQYRFGRNVEGDVIGIPGTTADVLQHSVMMSLIYHFK